VTSGGRLLDSLWSFWPLTLTESYSWPPAIFFDEFNPRVLYGGSDFFSRFGPARYLSVS
jgi:hypothetical protein